VTRQVPEQPAVADSALNRAEGVDYAITRDPFQPQLFCDSNGGRFGVAFSKNSKVYKAERHHQVTVLICVHTVRVLTVRTEVFNLCLLHVRNVCVQSPC